MTELSMKLWAKTDQTSGQWHPLLFHMLDAAQVASALWGEAFSPALQSQFSGWLDCDPADAIKTLSFWTALHDLGKASPAFQRKYSPIQSELEILGLGFPDLPSPMPHGLVTAWGLETLLPATGLSTKETKLLGRALAGHHGMWPTAPQLIDLSKNANLGGVYLQTWESARCWLFDTLRELLTPVPVHLPEDQREQNAFLALFSGFVSTADWIASMENMFPYADSLIPLVKYQQRSARQAHEAIHQLGFCGWKADGSTLDFNKTFNFPPTELQKEVLEKAALAELPAMLIVEAPTGCGKTEVAFSVADAWLQKSGGQGLYIAMPTMATSNQMFTRTKDNYLAHRYPNDQINIQLAHGSALLEDDFQNMILQSVGEDAEAGLAAMGWFLPRKRTLLAPFAVGTVDQALLSVLQTRHFFVRLFGLGGKVVIFDEVHAYDAYMSSLFYRLLDWLHAAGISVILLSATLPNQTRSHLVEAYTGYSCPEIVASYPSYTVIEATEAHSYPLPILSSKSIALEWIGPTPEEITTTLRNKLQNGGCAVVICNTVRRAQEVYQIIRQAEICPPQDCLLFHARFPFERRQEIEKTVLARFGKNAKEARPHYSILVATQVVEQSLDLDFDLMISDLAPIDLLIQRAGRLHRHSQHPRPATLTSSTLILCSNDPMLEDTDAPAFGDSRFVYEPYLLWRTWAVLQGKDVLELPAATQELIETVYGEADLPELQRFQGQVAAAQQKMTENNEKAERAAKERLILSPGDAGLLKMQNENLDEENPNIHQSLQAMTRLAAPGIQLVCLHRLSNGGLNTHADGSGVTIHLSQTPDHATQQALLSASLNIQNYDALRYFQNVKPPSAWNKAAALRFHSLAEFSDGFFQPEGSSLRLILDSELGLSITKEV